ncbi:MAG: hypothetical protein ACO1O4_08785 [Devosia sp.]
MTIGRVHAKGVPEFILRQEGTPFRRSPYAHEVALSYNNANAWVSFARLDKAQKPNSFHRHKNFGTLGNLKSFALLIGCP